MFISIITGIQKTFYTNIRISFLNLRFRFTGHTNCPYFLKFMRIKLVIRLETLCRIVQRALVHLRYVFDQVEEGKKQVLKI